MALVMFPRRLPLPPPRSIPWQLKTIESAETSLSYDEFGRMVLRIRHDTLKGVSPEMVAWWFGNIGGDMKVKGSRLNKYLVWHPNDHIFWELVRPGEDGGASIGAQFRIVEAFGRNPDFYVDVINTVTRLDVTGFTALTYKLGQEIARLNHDFISVNDGTQYLSTLIVGSPMPFIGRFINAGVHRALFTEAMGRAWFKHNIEEVGLFEHILPSNYAGSLTS